MSKDVMKSQFSKNAKTILLHAVKRADLATVAFLKPYPEESFGLRKYSRSSVCYERQTSFFLCKRKFIFFSEDVAVLSVVEDKSDDSITVFVKEPVRSDHNVRMHDDSRQTSGFIRDNIHKILSFHRLGSSELALADREKLYEFKTLKSILKKCVGHSDPNDIKRPSTPLSPSRFTVAVAKR